MTETVPDEIHTTLQHYFGYNAFRPFQEKIITAILDGHDCLAILPTGGGKSLCFQIPGLLLEGMTVVISPLISLMEDQVQQLQKRGIAAEMLNSALSPTEKSKVIKKIGAKEVQFIYLSPEQLHTEQWQQLSKNLKIPLVVVDEAHCISQWGHDFRPSYRVISRWLQTRVVRPIVAAFTATATQKTVLDIQTNLGLTQTQLFKQDQLPEHLFLSLLECPDGHHKTIRLLQILRLHRGQSGIIYTLTRKAAEEVTQFLRQIAIYESPTQIDYYHGGMKAEARAQVQRSFLENKIKVIVATNAFGMGVDKPDIRFLVHYQLPNSLEAYYQEVGRAGRDRQPAHCYLLALALDTKTNYGLIKNDLSKKRAFSYILRLIKVSQCVKSQLAYYFSLLLSSKHCGNCSRCKKSTLITTDDHQIYEKLLKIRNEVAMQNKLEPSLVLSQYQAAMLSILRPMSSEELKNLPGFGTGWIRDCWPLLQNGKLYAIPEGK